MAERSTESETATEQLSENINEIPVPEQIPNNTNDPTAIENLQPTVVAPNSNKDQICQETPKLAQTSLLTTGYVTRSTLLQPMSVTKVTVKLRGVKSNRKIITCLRSLINPHSITWDTWIPYVKCALNCQINSATGETPHYIIFGEDKILPYDLLSATPSPIYNEDDFIKNRINKFQTIYQRVREHMNKYSEQMREQQHKIAKVVNLKPGDIVMSKLHVPIANSNKLSPKYTGPYKVISAASGNKFQLQNLKDGEVVVKHSDDLKLTSGLSSESPLSSNDNNMSNDSPGNLVNNTNGNKNDNVSNSNSEEQDKNKVDEYRKKLRSHTKYVNVLNDINDIEQWKSNVNHVYEDKILKVKDDREIEHLLSEWNTLKSHAANEIEKVTQKIDETDFYEYIDEILSELGVDCNSFYR